MTPINSMLDPWLPTFQEHPSHGIVFDPYENPFDPWLFRADRVVERDALGNKCYPKQESLDFTLSYVREIITALYRIPHHPTICFTERRIIEKEEFFQNGHRRKNPYIVEDDVYTDYPAAEVREPAEDQAVVYLKRAATLVGDSTNRRWLNLRARLITEMTVIHPDATATVTLHPDRVNVGNITTKTEWSYFQPTGIPNRLFARECLQFFTPLMLKMVREQYELPLFKFVFTRGFCTELHCPRWYWDRMQFRLQMINLNNLRYKHADLNDNPVERLIGEFKNDPIQPLQQVFFTDAPDHPPVTPVCITKWGRFDFENCNLIAPYLPRIVRINSTDSDLTKPDGEGNMSLSSDPNPPGASECDSSQPSPPCSPPSVGPPASSAISPPPGVGPSSGPSGPA